MSAWATRLVAVALLLAASTGGARAAWVWQANAYKAQLAKQADDYGLDREKATAAALDQLAEQQEARRALEARLQAQAQTHWKEMEDAQHSSSPA